MLTPIEEQPITQAPSQPHARVIRLHPDAGVVIAIQDLGARLFQQLLDTASGRRARSELHGYGQNEFMPWQASVIT